MRMQKWKYLTVTGFVMGGVLLLAAAIAAPAAWAEDKKDREIRELRELVERLGQRLNQLEQGVGLKKEAAAVAPAPGAPAASAEAAQSLGDRIKNLEEALKGTPILATMKDWQFGGHVAVSYNYNFRDPKSQNNTFRLFDEKANQFDVNQAELYVEKPTSEASPAGFGFDVLLGRDAKKVHSTGLGETNQPFDLTQAYVTYKVPFGKGIDLKGGKFVTLHGAEVIRRTGNFNISRSLAFSWAIPFTHTGLMATYPVTDWLSTTLGIVNGWDNTDDNNRGKSFHGAATITPPFIKDFTLTLGGTWGAEQVSNAFDPARDINRNGPKRGLIDLIATYKPFAPLTLTLNYDYGRQEEAFVDGGPSAVWHAVAAYAVYDITDKISVGVRGEYFKDQDGFRLPGATPGKQLEVWETTLTGRYKLFDHLFASIEYRHDEAKDNKLVFDRGNGTQNANTQNTIQGELIYQF
ncbi:porin [Candidatus Methylomirabilis sp.]|uniref:porin n=1 Tax=Candidatus Methylomirabilis sp. TaxID=2032687 RepID=UPI002A5E5D2D|nr:porin [Candidatus Methylomirabilis sp.]